MKNKKDATEKALEAYNDVFADIVNVLIYNGRAVVREEELEQGRDRSLYTGEKTAREQERDTTKYWKKNSIRIAMFGLENETEPEDDMPLRVIGYDGASYRDQIRYEKGEAGNRIKVLDRYPVITLVLYMGHEKRWDKARSLYDVLKDRLDTSLGQYVNDYRINLFEIAFLPDKVVSLFKSDFRFVADYLVQMRKYGTYRGSDEEMIHVREVMQLLAALTDDRRFAEAATLAKEEGKEIRTMCKWLDEIEERGIQKGIEQGIEQFIATLLTIGRTPEDIHEFCKIPLDEILKIQEKALEHA